MTNNFFSEYQVRCTAYSIEDHGSIEVEVDLLLGTSIGCAAVYGKGAKCCLIHLPALTFVGALTVRHDYSSCDNDLGSKWRSV